ncbi:hypothetical protein LV716_10600 [Flagellimonas sp. HMM57]|uniref:hypothetical protein n=1 Tax=unclassified Flagellimonas TaxID=2644544 RepID=UPI0013D47553|nr:MULTISPECIES: hypothetical protein [unclassified Flagellimonas]UII74715.1 hypothetical protein LV716_10600 [Flagellimonas sp. HMM57]
MSQIHISTFLVPLLLFNFNLNAQKEETTELKKIYQSRFQHCRESIHLHLNKTTFIQGDEIWWTAYAYNKKSNYPSNATKNLYCGLYNSKGEQVIKDLFLFDQAITHGSFKIDSTLNPGTYFIKADTKWMKNFEEDAPFVQKVTIVDSDKETESNSLQKDHDLQLLPEGGHLISDTDNMVGLRIVDGNGRGVQIQKGGVYDEENNQLTEVFTNEVGLGRFELLPKKQMTYTLKTVLIDGSIIEKKLPEAKSNGVAMAINNILEEKLIVSLNTNNKTFETIKKDSFHLAIHRDGIMTLNSFVFDSISRNIKISKKNLLPGTNIITLFNQNLEPISERLIFNFNGLRLANTSLTKGKTKKDSVYLKIKAYTKKNTPISLSVSALPAANTNNLNESNIFSSFLLHPYLKSAIENSSRYFSDSNRIKEYELDLAMLTQGWSSYDWGLIFKGEPVITYPFEHGVNAQLKLSSKLKKEERLVLIGDYNDSMVFLDMYDSQNLELTDLFSQNGDTLKFSIRKKRGGLRKPDLNIHFNSFDVEKDSIILKKYNHPYYYKLATTTRLNKTPLFRPSGDIIALDEVVLTEGRIEKKLTRKGPNVNFAFKGVKVDEAELKKSPFLTDLIARNGFRVDTRIPGALSIRNIIPSRGPVRVYVDDFHLQDIAQLRYVPLNQIDEIYFETQGLSGDIYAPGGVIRIYWKSGLSLGKSSMNFAEKLVKNSFSRPKTFYRPKYISTKGEAFENYGIVHWQPKLTTNKKGEVGFKIPKDNISSVKVYIEGMGEDGSLLSHTQEISLD